MIYSEFLEAIAAVAVHKVPDPFVPLVQRVERFVTVQILGSRRRSAAPY